MTDTTDIKALRKRLQSAISQHEMMMGCVMGLGKVDPMYQQCIDALDQLEAERQRAEKLQEDLRSMDAPTDAVRNHNLKLWAAIERLNKAEAEIAVMEKHTRGVEEALIAATDEISALKPDVLVMPDGLHQDTKALLLVFASAMAVKMHKAEQKCGYSNSWMQHDWQGKCLVDFNHHITKGDPLDVANYCAFMHYHGWPTALKGDQVQVITCYSCRKVMTRDQHAEADGFCPHCNVEIELDEDDLFTAPQKPVVLLPKFTDRHTCMNAGCDAAAAYKEDVIAMNKAAGGIVKDGE